MGKEMQVIESKPVRIRSRCKLCPCEILLSQMNRHLRTVHNQVELGHQCQLCDSKFQNSTGLNNHVKNNHLMKQCKLCDFKSTQQGVKIHTESIHNGTKYKCDDCEFSTKHKFFLHKHIKVQHVQHVFACIFCSKTCKTKGEINSHYIIRHKAMNLDKLQKALTYN